MNRYGRLLMSQWQQADPQRFSQIPDPEAFFTRKGRELATEIQTLAATLAGTDRPSESYLEKTARLSTARFNAESDLIREALLPSPGEETEEPLPPQWRSVAWEDPGDEDLAES